MTALIIQNNENSDFAQSWAELQNKFRVFFGQAKYKSWISHLDYVERNGSELILSAPTRFIREWIRNNYLETMADIIRKYHPSIKAIDVIVRSNIAANKNDNTRTKLRNVDYEHNSDNVVHPEDTIGSPIDKRLNFNNYVVGETNQLAHAAAKAIAQSNSIIAGDNPLYLYGGVGLGKTHLLHAIANYIRENKPERKVVYLSAEKFMYHFIKAVRNNDLMDFKEKFRGVDVLLIDDVQFICGKNSTQDEFFHTFNSLIDEKKQLVISGDRSPTCFDQMKENIRSRLSGGLVADIGGTCYELRLGILRAKLSQMRNVKIDDKVIEFLAENIVNNVRELEGALNKVAAHSLLIGKQINLELVQEILGDVLRLQDKIVTINEIQKKVADYFGIAVSELISRKRSRNIARPRQIAMFLSKNLTSRSLSEIGRKFGGKDHTTVIHAVKKVEELCSKEREYNEDVTLIRKSLLN